MSEHMHKVNILGWKDGAVVCDDTGQPIVDWTVATDQIEDAFVAAHEAVEIARDTACVRIDWCTGLFFTLADYIHALNAPVRLAEELNLDHVPTPVVDYLDYWASCGIVTPRDLEIYQSAGCQHR
ncbi:hypothetical protein ACOI1H_21475 [Loktanella sp. DJP18]|uniref:hypothetical protein n=1 Tax=Loktanella sp. DJP18 TaxID=3409788 RepID=UPI003BB7E2A4